MSASQPRWTEPRFRYRDGRVVCFDHMERAFKHGANPKHFAKVEGTPLCDLCEREARNTVVYHFEAFCREWKCEREKAARQEEEAK